jgi:hypothetical protein
VIDPQFHVKALEKLDKLLQTNPGADIAGVVLRIDNYFVTVTREGRVQWFEQDGLGGLKLPSTDIRPPIEAMAEINARHGRSTSGRKK